MSSLYSLKLAMDMIRNLWIIVCFENSVGLARYLKFVVIRYGDFKVTCVSLDNFTQFTQHVWEIIYSWWMWILCENLHVEMFLFENLLLNYLWCFIQDLVFICSCNGWKYHDNQKYMFCKDSTRIFSKGWFETYSLWALWENELKIVTNGTIS